MWTQLSYNMVTSNEPEYSCEVLVYQWSKFRHGISVHVFKEVYQRTKFSHNTYKASSGMEGERMRVVFGLIELELWHI